MIFTACTGYHTKACHTEKARAGNIAVMLFSVQKRLAKFMGTEEAIIYAYDLTTVPSILPAFANAKDLIVMDEVSTIVKSPTKP